MPTALALVPVLGPRILVQDLFKVLCLLVLLLVQDAYRIPVLLVMALAFLVAGVWALRAARSSLRQAGGSFEATRAELARDLAALARRDPPA